MTGNQKIINNFFHRHHPLKKYFRLCVCVCAFFSSFSYFTHSLCPQQKKQNRMLFNRCCFHYYCWFGVNVYFGTEVDFYLAFRRLRMHEKTNVVFCGLASQAITSASVSFHKNFKKLKRIFVLSLLAVKIYCSTFCGEDNFLNNCFHAISFKLNYCLKMCAK